MSSNDEPIKNVIQQWLEANKLTEKMKAFQLTERWEEIMGKMIAQHTVDIYLKDKILFLTIDSAPVRNELHYSKKQLIEVLNEAMGTKLVEEVVIR